MRGWLCLFGLMALAGCSFSETIAQHAIDYNKMVAEADDAQTLLNILRARDRAPMHFTTIQSVEGKLEQSSGSSLNLTIPFGGAATSVFPLVTSANVAQASKPVFQVGVLGNSEAFVNAISEPISLKTARLFWDQGWPKDLLIYMFVEKIEVREEIVRTTTKENGETVVERSTTYPRFSDTTRFPKLEMGCEKTGKSVVRNDPIGDDRDCFARIVHYLKPRYSADDGPVGLRLVDSVSVMQVGPPMPSSALVSLTSLLQVREKNHIIVEADSQATSAAGAGRESALLEEVESGAGKDEQKYLLCEVRETTGVCFSEDSCAAIETDPSEVCRKQHQEIGSRQAVPDLQPKTVAFTIAETTEKQALAGDGSGKGPSVTVERSTVFIASLRSLQGMIYYVGEMLRDRNGDEVTDAVYVAREGIPDDCPNVARIAGLDSIPIFEVRKGVLGSAAVSVDYLGETYWVPPKDRCSRSLQTLSFLNQVSGLYQSRADLPPSSTIRTIER